MLVQLYFATRRVYQPGDIVRFAHAPHLNGAAPSWLAMEAAFDAARPAGHPSRMNSRFACESMEDCLTYYAPQPGGTVGKRVYRVFMNEPVAVPMALTGRGQHHHAGPVILSAIAQVLGQAAPCLGIPRIYRSRDGRHRRGANPVRRHVVGRHKLQVSE